MLHIEIDGQQVEVAAGTTIMEAAESLGIYIPFFCYHPKLSVAANCRMCLVDVEKAPKPLPACATPVSDGMKIATASRKAKMAQQGVLEFLLINHPLDCPICDQGGECPLQDITMGFANPHSHYNEEKRVVEDKDIGPLITTEMTRCIQCTRCVRFGQEIGGIKELGATGRGEHMAIGTYVAKAVKSELSGNMIDLCPVGALTSKPFRYKARSWELKHTPGICPHCSTGCNTDVQSLGKEVLRVLPRNNEAVNEQWICDKGRYAYTGLNAPDRVTKPLLRDSQGKWTEVSWAEALEATLAGLEKVLARHGADKLAGLISGQSSNEELFLFQALLRGLGSPHVDHRLHQQDFRADAAMPLYPALNMSLEELEREPLIVLCHGFTRHQQPLTNHRLHKAVLNGGKVVSIDSMRQDFNFPVTQIVAGAGEDLALYQQLAGHFAHVHEEKQSDGLVDLAREMAAADNPLILIGSALLHHPQAADLLAQVESIAELAGGRIGWLADESNSAGAWLSGCVPQRAPGGHLLAESGLPAGACWNTDMQGFILFGVEPGVDSLAGAQAVQRLRDAEFVLSISHFGNEARQYADVILPMAAFAEGSGSYVNNEGRCQSFRAAVKLPGEARPGWKILRVLGDGLKLPDFQYNELSEVSAAWHHAVGDYGMDIPPFHAFPALEAVQPIPAGALLRLGDWPIYQGDPLVRRAKPLSTPLVARMHPDQARQSGIQGEAVEVSSASGKVTLALDLDTHIPLGCIWIPLGYPETSGLAAPYLPCSVAMAALLPETQRAS
ncbi:NADH-quinone oxidoreductase subunit G [Acidithiobacillus thiooxidans]|uniref:NADH-quinone oxidoreductase subunit NuoG n=1 Tax=Acidithiobacillus TaxID=119977 RepID=UPI00187AF4B1|nr:MULTISPECIES: NADH-quinone oxidoreductase subunit NuoG [Acidithiobacillus]MBE7566548.1 NADH-quinone oxidoreductase subunit G [Acidithiobacillus sp. HP-11]MBU2752776.1 NADH-quinone oxidoreductase subunit G [Acidithiobacillus thiooxidans]MBU2793726.1 NADH-quinone oxidoreductase subunit G [Acidithiobacillus thiooxidans]